MGTGLIIELRLSIELRIIELRNIELRLIGAPRAPCCEKETSVWRCNAPVVRPVVRPVLRLKSISSSRCDDLKSVDLKSTVLRSRASASASSRSMSRAHRSICASKLPKSVSRSRSTLASSSAEVCGALPHPHPSPRPPLPFLIRLRRYAYFLSTRLLQSSNSTIARSYLSCSM